ncbi:MAG: CvpA family protein [Clostridiales bacterium]|nr:CvpA family protein [Clostridiales bacterium]
MLVSLLVALVVGFVYFYVSLPALNFHAQEFYFFVGLVCAVYIFTALITSGFDMLGSGNGLKQYLAFIKAQCLPVGILLLLLVLVGAVGSLISMPIFRASAYRNLLTVEQGDFAKEVEEISFDQIPMLDDVSAQRLGNRKLGELDDMVSQFEVADIYAQINHRNRPVRATYLEYGDLIKWLNNRKNGLPAYIIVDMVTQEARVVRLSEGIKYSPSELFGRNLYRHLRFQYPTYMFSTPIFEIDEDGHPWWVCPKLEKTIGLFGGTDINGAVLMDAITGESTYLPPAEIPTWVDRVYSADLIIEQYDYHGTLVNGFFNSLLGQKAVTVTTEGYNYIAMHDDVYMYTGITSVGSDQSNVGFLLCNQRTKETKYYKCSGATEYSAMDSAEGVVQHLKYRATFPLLLNIAGEPTYFMAMKDDSELVKMYAMVNVRQYQVVATGASVAECEAAYVILLSRHGIITEVDLPETSITGTIAEVRAAVLEGNSFYFVRLEGETVFYSLSASENPVVVILNLGDTVTIEHAVDGGDGASILDGYMIAKD